MFGLARECLYRLLAAALSEPGKEKFRPLFDPANLDLAQEAADLLRAEAADRPVTLGFGELPADRLDLAPLRAALGRPPEELQADYQRVFGLVYTGDCSPYETAYHSTSEPFFRSQQMADVAGFYQAFGLALGRTTAERPDHIALELEFLAFVLLKKRLAEEAEHAAICEEALRTFFRDHLAWWVPSFATGLRRKAEGGFYAAVGQVLAALLPLERTRYQVVPPRFPLQPEVAERPEEEPQCAGCSGPV